MPRLHVAAITIVTVSIASAGASAAAQTRGRVELASIAQQCKNECAKDKKRALCEAACVRSKEAERAAADRKAAKLTPGVGGALGVGRSLKQKLLDAKAAVGARGRHVVGATLMVLGKGAEKVVAPLAKLPGLEKATGGGSSAVAKVAPAAGNLLQKAGDAVVVCEKIRSKGSCGFYPKCAWRAGKVRDAASGKVFACFKK